MHLRNLNSVLTFCLFCLVLQAINDDSPTVPTLLTDYILKGMSDKNCLNIKFFTYSDFYNEA